MTAIPATIDLNPSDTPQATVIWFHGLGADGSDFVPIVEQLKLPESYQVRFVFPHAPQRPITINHGISMRAWYDISEINLGAQEDLEGIKHSEALVHHLIEREINLGIKSERIILAGFSQGGAIALYSGLRYPQTLGAILALSTYLPMADTLKTERNIVNQGIPIYLAHGLFDPIVPLMMGEMSRQQLESLEYQVSWHTYPMPHTVVPEEIQDISRFLNTVLTRLLSFS